MRAVSRTAAVRGRRRLPGGLGDLLKGGLGGAARRRRCRCPVAAAVPVACGGSGSAQGRRRVDDDPAARRPCSSCRSCSEAALGGALGGRTSARRHRGRRSATSGGDGDACSSELEQILCGATNDVSEYWIDQLPLSFGRRLRRHADRVLLRVHQHRLRSGVVADRAVLLPARQPRVLRSRLPGDAPEPVRRHR